MIAQAVSLAAVSLLLVFSHARSAPTHLSGHVMNGGVSQAWPLTPIVNFTGLVAVSPPIHLPFHSPGVCFILQ